MQENIIDFVLPWVDGSDPDWIAEKTSYQATGSSDASPQRYRDWDLLRFWFRGVERFAPWVNRIWFVTWGHVPEWLNTCHPKIQIINHRDYIPHEYLPTFNSHPIELNVHRISGLSEQFVLFNDDMFLCRKLSSGNFFHNGLPRDTAVLAPLHTNDLCSGGTRIFYIPFNNIQYINREINFRQILKSHPLHWYNIHYGTRVFSNLLLSAWNRFPGIADYHLPLAYTKTSFEKAWQTYGDVFDATCRHHFRDDHDVSHWLIRYYRLAEAQFAPQKPVRNACLTIGADNTAIRNAVQRHTKPMICLNDVEMSPFEFEENRAVIYNIFLETFPNPSSFER